VPRRLDAPGGIALTFDDGPHPQGTPRVVEALQRGGAIATFFLCGEQAERYPSVAAEIVAGGHSIALHGYRHRVQLRQTGRQVADDLDRGLAAVEEASGVRPTTYRPPLGIFSFPGLRAARERGLEPLLWSRWGHDWRGGRAAAAIAAEATEDLRGGDVILLHDADHYSAPECWRGTVAALPRVLEVVAQAALRPVPLSAD
jgi:peptidoglycan/xylan/chitin deacetylase (PgdA/CDA1 family)